MNLKKNILVNVKDTSKDYDVEYKAWLSVYDMEINFDECPECGNNEGLYYEVALEDESACLSVICPKCHCLDKHEL